MKLLKLLGAVAGLGVLALFLLPVGCACEYTRRSQISEGPSLSEGLKLAMAEYFAGHDKWPPNLREAGYPGPTTGEYVTGMSTANGVITIAYASTKAHPDVRALVLSIVAAPNANGDIAWVCGFASAPPGHTMASPAATSGIKPRWLPAACMPGS